MSEYLSPDLPAIQTFTPSELAFALAWAEHVPLLGGCTVEICADEDGEEFVYVQPLVASDGGYTISNSEIAGVEIQWDGLRERAVAFDLRGALELICPLSPEIVAKIEAQAEALLPVF